MDIPDALEAGLIVGVVIATQFGAVSALLLETAVRAGPRAKASGASIVIEFVSSGAGDRGRSDM